jgi:hypothetical protein
MVCLVGGVSGLSAACLSPVPCGDPLHSQTHLGNQHHLHSIIHVYKPSAWSIAAGGNKICCTAPCQSDGTGQGSAHSVSQHP